MNQKITRGSVKILLTILMVFQIGTPLSFSAEVANKETGESLAENVNVNKSDNNAEGSQNISDWSYAFFGSNTAAEKNPEPIIDPSGSITMQATGGKISRTDEGISFYAGTIDNTKNFELTADVEVLSFNQDTTIGTAAQKSFGLMLKDDINVASSNYVAVGALDTVMKGFYKNGEQLKLDQMENTALPIAGESYQLSIRKVGTAYVLKVGEAEETIISEHLFSDTVYLGIFVARDAHVTFKNITLNVMDKEATSLIVDTSMMKRSYLIGEALDTSELSVTAVMDNGEQQKITMPDYIITGFDSSLEGTNSVIVRYGNATAKITLEIKALKVEKMKIKYKPAKTEYYIGDTLDMAGLEVLATYNNGEEKKLDETQYTVDSEATFTTAGTKTITLVSTITPSKTVSFQINVSNAEIVELIIKKQPSNALFFVGDILDLEGLLVYAKYSDSSLIRLNSEEYAKSAIDMQTVGTKQIEITYKGKTKQLSIEVKEKEAIGIEVIQYPKTTYDVGSAFDETGLVVAKKYDNGEKIPLPLTEYQLLIPSFDNVGLKVIKIVPLNQQFATIDLAVTVKELHNHIWQSVIFGQSASKEKNTVVTHSDGSVEITALEGGGKITGDHDGIAFYYTELDATTENFQLSATIDVKAYAKTPHDGQESFGIVARDAIAENLNSSVFASNIAAIGGYSGGTKLPNGIQLLARTGVEAPDGTGSKGVQSVMLEEGSAIGTYQLALEKTNSGFTGKIMNGEQATIFEPNILTAQNGKMYVGFYTARLATIIVSDIKLDVSQKETDAPQITPPAVPKVAALDIVSLPTTATEEYILRVKANTEGQVSIRKDDTYIVSDQTLQADTIFEVPTTVAAGDTNMSIVFYPDDTAFLTSYDKIINNFTVSRQAYSGDIYVSPAGQPLNSGAEDQPLDLDTAITYVSPGQKIILLDGIYTRDKKLEIKKYNDGREAAYKTLMAAPGAHPILDFSKKAEGIELAGHYWHIIGIDITNSGPNMKGFTIGGSHNKIERLNIYRNGDTGLQISRLDPNEPREQWPSYNRILNVTSYDNRDPSNNNADGFAAKLTVGDGNIFSGCIAYNNIDDGWDLYTKVGTGAIGAVRIENSVAYNNGYVSFDENARGDGNGFKIGGEGIHVPHVISNSKAFGNLAYGVTSNSNPGLISENIVSYNNVGGNIDFVTFSHITPDFKMTNIVSYQDTHQNKDKYPAYMLAEDTYLFDGITSQNKNGEKIEADYFVSLDAQLPYQRDETGNIIWGDFLAKAIKINKQPLEELLIAAKGISNDEQDYTNESYKNLVETIITIEENMANFTTQLEVDEAIQQLQAAVEQLVYIEFQVSYLKTIVLEIDETTTEADFITALNLKSDIPFTVTTNFTEVVNLVEAGTHDVAITITKQIQKEQQTQINFAAPITDTITVTTVLKNSETTTVIIEETTASVEETTARNEDQILVATGEENGTLIGIIIFSTSISIFVYSRKKAKTKDIA